MFFQRFGFLRLNGGVNKPEGVLDFMTFFQSQTEVICGGPICPKKGFFSSLFFSFAVGVRRARSLRRVGIIDQFGRSAFFVLRNHRIKRFTAAQQRSILREREMRSFWSFAYSHTSGFLREVNCRHMFRKKTAGSFRLHCSKLEFYLFFFLKELFNLSGSSLRDEVFCCFEFFGQFNEKKNVKKHKFVQYRANFRLCRPDKKKLDGFLMGW